MGCWIAVVQRAALLPELLVFQRWNSPIASGYWLSLANVIEPYALYGEPRSYGVDISWEY